MIINAKCFEYSDEMYLNSIILVHNNFNNSVVRMTEYDYFIHINILYYNCYLIKDQ